MSSGVYISKGKYAWDDCMQIESLDAMWCMEFILYNIIEKLSYYLFFYEIEDFVSVLDYKMGNVQNYSFEHLNTFRNDEPQGLLNERMDKKKMYYN